MGWFPTAIRKALMDPQHIGGQKVQDMARQKGGATARSYVEGRCRKAFDFIGGLGPGVTEKIRSIVHFSHVYIDWRGRAATTDRAVLRAHFQVAMRVRSLSYTASVREIAEATCVSSIGTVSASHRRIVKRGLLKRPMRHARQATSAGAMIDEQAIRWTLCERPETSITQPNNLFSSGGCEECSGWLTDQSSDVFRWSALGKSAERVYETLGRMASGATANEAASALRMKRPAVLKQLRKLEAHERATRSAGR